MLQQNHVGDWESVGTLRMTQSLFLPMVYLRDELVRAATAPIVVGSRWVRPWTGLAALSSAVNGDLAPCGDYMQRAYNRCRTFPTDQFATRRVWS